MRNPSTLKWLFLSTCLLTAALCFRNSASPPPPTQRWIDTILQATTPPTSATMSNNEQQDINLNPLARTVLFGLDKGTEMLSPEVVYRQRSTETQIQGLAPLQAACTRWDATFAAKAWYDGDRTVQSTVTRVAVLPTSDMVSSCTLRVFWNVSWVSPLTPLVAWPCRERHYVPYTHLASQVSTFSWRSVGEVLAAFIRTGVLWTPLACIQGVTELKFERQSQSTQTNDSSAWKVTHIEEELMYATDLKQGRLLNRKCTADLRLFLEVG